MYGLYRISYGFTNNAVRTLQTYFNNIITYLINFIQVRFYSREPAKRTSFLARLYENFKDEMAKNKEMKESLKKFREEAQKLEQSDALKAARQKFETVEKEASKSSEVFKESLDSIKVKVKGVIDEASKSDLAKKAGKFTEGVGKTTHRISETAQEISKTGAFQSISEATKAVKQEIDNTSMEGLYTFIFSKSLHNFLED